MSGLEAFGVVGVGGPPTTAQEISQGWPKLAAGTGVLGLAGGVSGPANIDDAGVVGVGGPPQPNTPPQSDPLGAFGGPGVVGLAGGVGTPSNLDISATGVYGQGPYCGVRAVGGSYGIYASVQNVSSGAAGYFNGTVSVGGELWAGNTHIIGNFTVYGGSKSVAVPFPDGTHRLLYCLESPECWFEDFGEAKLVKGKAEVKLTREFATLIKKDSYHVFLTPYGHSHGLYVSSRTGASFVVKEQNEGKSTLKFSYRIVGKRKDVKAERFAKVTAPKLPEPPSAAVTKEKGKAKRKA
jgi:hypothetical protein